MSASGYSSEHRRNSDGKWRAKPPGDNTIPSPSSSEKSRLKSKKRADAARQTKLQAARARVQQQQVNTSSPRLSQGLDSSENSAETPAQPAPRRSIREDLEAEASYSQDASPGPSANNTAEWRTSRAEIIGSEDDEASEADISKDSEALNRIFVLCL